MSKEEILRTLTGRTLRFGVTIFAPGLITAFGDAGGVAATPSGCIMQGVAVVSYILAKGRTDATHEKSKERHPIGCLSLLLRV